MKTLIMTAVMLISSLSLAQEGPKENRPIRCKVKHVSGLTSVYPCQEKLPNTNANLNSYCTFDKGWKIGSLRPANKPGKRFGFRYNCTDGIDYAEVNDDNKIHGPKLYDPEYVSPVVPNKYTNVVSKYPMVNPKLPYSENYPEKIPYTCFKSHVKASGASNVAVQCGTTVGTKNRCILKTFRGQKIGGIIYSGTFWTYTPDTTKATEFVCNGGVILGKPTKGDSIYKMVDSDFFNLASDERVAQCYEHISANSEIWNWVDLNSCSDTCPTSTRFTFPTWGGSGCCLPVGKYNKNGTDQLAWAYQNRMITPTLLTQLTASYPDSELPGVLWTLAGNKFTTCQKVVIEKKIQ